MNQFENFARAIEVIAVEDSGVKHDLKEYSKVLDKRSRKRKFTLLEEGPQ